MGGWGYSFSMWQMWQMLSKCILPHFAADFLAQKPYLCTEFQSALKLQSTQTTQTTKITKNYANNEYEYKKILNS